MSDERPTDLGGFSADEIARLKRVLAHHRYEEPLDLTRLTDRPRRDRSADRAWLLRIAAALVLASIGTWTLAWLTLARARHQQVIGDAIVDEVSLYDGERLLRSESWEQVRVRRPASPSGEGLRVPEPFVTNATATDGENALLISSAPEASHKVVWSCEPSDVTSGTLVYFASVYLSQISPAGFIIGLVQAGDGSFPYDKAAVVFANGEVRAWSADRVVATYEPRRWYRLRVEARPSEHTMAIELDGHVVAKDVPTLGPDGIMAEHPEWPESRIWEAFDGFGFGGVYDGSLLSEERVPLVAEPAGDGATRFVLDGSVAGWRPSSIMLRAGDRVHIEADLSREIRYAGRTASARTNPDGCLMHMTNPCEARMIQRMRHPVPVQSAWFGSLVARVGTGSGFFAGSRVDFTVSEPGELLLAYNDNASSDNAGEFVVIVKVKRAGEAGAAR